MGNCHTVKKKHERSKSTIIRESRHLSLETYFLAHKDDINPKLKLAFGKALAFRNLEEEELNLIFVRLMGSQVHHLVELMPFYTHIKKIFLWKTKLGTEGALLLAPTFQKLTKLEVLGLEDNSIGDEGVKAVTQAIEPLTALRELYLPVNMIKDQGAKYIGKTLENKLKLELLYLDENEITDAGLEHVLTGLKENQALKVLGLANNKLSDNGVELMMRDFPEMLTLTKLLLKGNPISEEAKKKLDAAAASVEIIV